MPLLHLTAGRSRLDRNLIGASHSCRMGEGKLDNMQDSYKELSDEVGESQWMLPTMAFSFMQPPKDRCAKASV